jgi:thiamine biosynthesis lipoprotein
MAWNRRFQYLRLVFVLALVWVIYSYTCADRDPAQQTVSFRGETMGTTFEVKVVAESLSETRQNELRSRITSELDDVNEKMSHYREDSELSRFNRSDGIEPFHVSSETFEVFRRAEELSELTEGAFDVTVGPLVNAWGFGPKGQPERVPTDEEITEIKDKIGFDKLELDMEQGTIRKIEPAIVCDLSAIAKGYGVDRVASALDAEGLRDYMVEVGGEVKTRGVNAQGDAWRIGIEKPIVGGRTIQKIVSLSDVAMATSGDYRNYYEVDGERISHMIDPRSGRPISHRLASVTVIDDQCTSADGWATALMVLGPDEGYALAKEQDLPVYFLVHDGESGFRELTTPAFERLAAESDKDKNLR